MLTKTTTQFHTHHLTAREIIILIVLMVQLMAIVVHLMLQAVVDGIALLRVRFVQKMSQVVVVVHTVAEIKNG